SFVSVAEMAGRKRRKRRKRVPKKLIVPNNRPKSTQVGLYIAQLEGKKSRWRETTTITNRSDHIPTFTSIETIQVATTLVRIFLAQNTCGARTLQKISNQNMYANAPNIRLATENSSYLSALYQPMNVSIRYP